LNKISVSSPSNIALIKYWGMSDAQHTLPNNASLSMTLKHCVSYCTLSPQTRGTTDEILWKTGTPGNRPQAIRDRDFDALADAVEREAVELHMITMTSQPSVFYWQQATLRVLARVRLLRLEGLQVCATVDAGPNVHVLCAPQDAQAAYNALRTLPDVERWIFGQAGDGPRQLTSHLI
jgi:mevalonate pyrophosphate decarboxylase